MAQLISIEELEATINRALRAAPPVNGRLSPELCILAEIYGNMIYARARSVDLEQLADDIKPLAGKLLGLASIQQPSIDSGSKVCPYDPNAETCDVCQ